MLFQLEKRNCFTCRGDDRKNIVIGTVKFSKMMNNFKKCVCVIPYFLSYEMEVASLLNILLVSGCDGKLCTLYFS